MLTSAFHFFVFIPVTVLAALVVASLAYIWLKFAPLIVRIFEETPVFAPLQGSICPDAEECRIRTSDGLELAGSYLKAFTPRRSGVIVFCPEFLGSRWSISHYADGLREEGFDLLTFDFRNHGGSQTEEEYSPLQWVSDRELLDLKAVLEYADARPDRDPAGVGLFGVSRGGGAALCVASEDPRVWGVITDGAFSTHGTMRAYIRRWASIGIRSRWVADNLPTYAVNFAAWCGRMTSQARSGRHYPHLEKAVARLAPRPWLVIHGEKDAYIGPDLALSLFASAREPKECWIVEGAKHNRCCEADSDAYRTRILDFFRIWAPRRLPAIQVTRSPQAIIEDHLPRCSLSSLEDQFAAQLAS